MHRRRAAVRRRRAPVHVGRAAASAKFENLDISALEAYMASPVVLPASYKKKDLLVYALGIQELSSTPRTA